MPSAYVVPEGESYVTITICGMNMQSSGTVTLKSADPNDDAVLGPDYFSHPYDRRVMLEGTLAAMKFLTTAPALRELLGGTFLGRRATPTRLSWYTASFFINPINY